MARSSTRPKRHHFIPQMMLRHFADDDGQLRFWRRDFAEGDVRETTTQSLFVEKELYTLKHLKTQRPWLRTLRLKQR